ncbi:MAG: hypothetical protein RBS72_19840 [Sedimentisphaerales bacterium]|jgi:hypothetical protein|nr:hypothetical protein [Sedimentisphaerales bacterium]HOH66029.1 hypothetical protein [Sedimentisphaerales bacterium]HQA89770.1 hypothetical protein [Sedimentisphaerales bacterium]
MVREDLIIHKTPTVLSELLAPMRAQVDRQQKRFLTQGDHGIRSESAWSNHDMPRI